MYMYSMKMLNINLLNTKTFDTFFLLISFNLLLKISQIFGRIISIACARVFEKPKMDFSDVKQRSSVTLKHLHLNESALI